MFSIFVAQFSKYSRILTVTKGMISFINCYSVTFATRAQIIFTTAKLSSIAIIIGGGIYHLLTSTSFNRVNIYRQRILRVSSK